MNETTNETKPGESFPGVDESKSTLSGIVSAPPSPMPIPAASGAPQTSTAPESAPDTSTRATPPSPEKFSKYRDYKGRNFDPRLHYVKADGSPELTREGKLKILPPSKRSEKIVSKIESLFNTPPSDHVLNAEEEQAAIAQADGAANAEAMEARARASSELYFGAGAAILSSGFLRGKSKRQPKIVSAAVEYERRTGKAFDLPPGLAFTAVLVADISETVATEKECADRVSAYKGFIFARAAKSAVAGSRVGRFFGRVFGKRNPETSPSEELRNQSSGPITANPSPVQ